MKRHIKYLQYVLRHKWFVFTAGIKLSVPLWQLIVHDWHKFLPAEWFPYARTFYAPDGSKYKNYVETEAFNYAWNAHQKRGRHHWQAWLLTMDTGTTSPLPMPEKYAREMVADWKGAGKALGKPDTVGWYKLNKDKMILHPSTREMVEGLLGIPPTPPIVPVVGASIANAKATATLPMDIYLPERLPTQKRKRVKHVSRLRVDYYNVSVGYSEPATLDIWFTEDSYKDFITNRCEHKGDGIYEIKDAYYEHYTHFAQVSRKLYMFLNGDGASNLMDWLAICKQVARIRGGYFYKHAEE